ncbi:MAG: alpha/beta hydrolase [Bacillota bacterium]|nr:alpha/beta hydrolase [Bacillota bacterium]
MTVLSVLFGVIILLNIAGFAVTQLRGTKELDQVKPYSELVEVDGKKMHVYKMGEGDKTIVLMPGLGIALPSADFGPLMRTMKDDYKVVAVEYFGIGFSDVSDQPRTNENYIKELREALQKSGLKPPYVLMPHSASGIYAEYYAAQYPDEIEAIIMLDTTSSAELESVKIPRFVYSLGKIQQATGFSRLVSNLIPEFKLIENGYTEKEQADYKLFTYFGSNDTVIDQAVLFGANIQEVSELKFPETIPVLKLIASNTLKTMGKKSKDDGMGYQTKHLNRLGQNASFKVIEGSHMIYQTQSELIKKYTDEFLSEL